MLGHYPWINDEIFSAALVPYVAEKATPGGAPTRGFAPGLDHLIDLARAEAQKRAHQASYAPAPSPEWVARYETGIARLRQRGLADQARRKQLALGATDGK